MMMTHVWQHQLGINVTVQGVLNRNYDFSDAFKEKKSFSQLKIEQQAQMIQNYYNLKVIGPGHYNAAALAYFKKENLPILSIKEYYEIFPENLRKAIDAWGPDLVGEAADRRCFAAGTPIEMADGSKKLIETIRSGDLVASFDETADGGRGALVGRRVVRTFVNENQLVIDFHGTKVTPGHVYLCGDGPHEGRFRQIMTIIRDDGAVVLADGTLMRAATGCLVASAGDAFVELRIARPARHRVTGEDVTLLKERGRVRAGTRVQRPDGSFFSFLDLIQANGWTLHEDGLVSQTPGHTPEPLLWAGRAIPKPEDTILALSQLTLADLYDDPRQVDPPEGRPLHRQGEAGAIVLEAGGLPTDDDRRESSGPSFGSRMRALIDAGRRKQNRAPRHAGDVVH